MSLFAKSVASLLLGMSAFPVAAAHFTLEVPVRVQNAPSIVSLTVECLVSRVRVDEPYPAGSTNVIGRGSQRVLTSGANYDNVVLVEVNADGIIPAAEARSYSCSMRASGNARTGGGYAASSASFREAYETATGQTLDRLTVIVRGNL